MKKPKSWEYQVLQDIKPWEAEGVLMDYGQASAPTPLKSGVPPAMKPGWECYAVVPYELNGEPFVYLYLKR